MSTLNINQISRNYYAPSRSLVEYLQLELQSLKSGSSQKVRGKPIRDIKSRNKVARRKNYVSHQIFQAFTDVIYFIEFIEDHPELHDLYEETLQDFFGVVADPQTDPHHYRNPGGMFDRFIRASLLNNLGSHKEIDFRVILIKIMIKNIIDALLFLMDTPDEKNAIYQESSRFSLWTTLLTKNLKINRKTEPRNLCGFMPYHTHRERTKMKQKG